MAALAARLTATLAQLPPAHRALYALCLRKQHLIENDAITDKISKLRLANWCAQLAKTNCQQQNFEPLIPIQGLETVEPIVPDEEGTPPHFLLASPIATGPLDRGVLLAYQPGNAGVLLNKRNINHLKPLARRILEEARKDNNLAKLLAVSFGIEAHASSKIKQSIRNEPSKWLSLASLHGYYGGPFPVFHPMFLNDVKDVLATDVLFDGAITLGMALPEDLNLMPPCKPILGEFRWSSKAELIESINHGWWFPFTCSKDFAKYLAEGDNATKAYPNILERLAPDISMAVQLNDYIKQQACSTLMYGNKRRPFSEAQNSLDFSR